MVRWTELRVPASVAAAALLGALVACDLSGPDPPTRRTLLVQHHAEECLGPWGQLCLLVKDPAAPAFGRHYGAIEGLDYEWGFVYEIDVEEHRIANPPADGPSTRTVLRRLVSKERVPPGTEFDIFLTARLGGVVEVALDRYRFYGAAEFVCPADAGCAELRSQVAAGERIRYRFQHPAAPGAPLVVVRWEVCDSALIGSRTCS